MSDKAVTKAEAVFLVLFIIAAAVAGFAIAFPPTTPPVVRTATVTQTATSVVTTTATATTTVIQRPEVKKAKIAWTSAPDMEIPSIYAKESGLFDAEGIEVQLVAFGSGRDAVGALVSGDVHMYVQTAVGLIGAVAGGTKIKGVYEVYDRFPANMMVRADSKLKSINDIKGTKIGITRTGSASWGVAVFFATKLGIDPNKDMTILNTGSQTAIVAALLKGEIDVGVLYQPFSAKGLADKAFRELEGSAFPKIDNYMMLVTDDLIKKDPDLVSRMVRAYRKAVTQLSANPDRGAAVALIYAPDIPFDVHKLAIKTPIGALNPSGKFSLDALDATQDFLVAGGVIKQKIPVRDLIDESFLKA